MTTKNNIICLGVNELYQDKDVQQPITTQPSLCFFEFTEELKDTIDKVKKLLFEQSFHEVTIQVFTVNWYFNLTNRYHHNVQSFLHISQESIYFSGILSPYKKEHFSTARININQLSFNQIPIKEIDLNQLTIPLAIGLINKIQNLSKLHLEQEELYYGIDPIITELRELDKKTALDIHLDSESQLDFLNKKANEIYSKMEKIEGEVNLLASQLVYQIFGIMKGDWISYVDPINDMLIQLQFEQCNVYNGILNITGPVVTKAGVLGKREQYINIKLGESD